MWNLLQFRADTDCHNLKLKFTYLNLSCKNNTSTEIYWLGSRIRWNYPLKYETSLCPACKWLLLGYMELRLVQKYLYLWTISVHILQPISKWTVWLARWPSHTNWGTQKTFQLLLFTTEVPVKLVSSICWRNCPIPIPFYLNCMCESLRW